MAETAGRKERPNHDWEWWFRCLCNLRHG